MTSLRVLPYVAIGLIASALYVVAPEWMPLATRVATFALFVMSLDLLVGYCGLVSLGHAALWGVGSYATAILAVHGLSNPLAGLLAGGLAGAFTAFLSGLVLLRFSGLAFIVLTIAFSQVLLNLASKFRSITGGDDGLSGFNVGRLLGVFEFDLEGRVAFVYSIVVLTISLLVLRRLVASPFGYSCKGVMQNRLRMEALGLPIRSTLMKMYCISGFFAGLAGALSTQVNQVAGLDGFGFALSAEALVMLVLGGAGTIFGGVVGATFFTIAHHTASTWNPYHWLFVIGGLLMIAALLPRALIAAWFGRTSRSLFRPRAASEAAA